MDLQSSSSLEALSDPEMPISGRPGPMSRREGVEQVPAGQGEVHMPVNPEKTWSIGPEDVGLVQVGSQVGSRMGSQAASVMGSQVPWDGGSRMGSRIGSRMVPIPRDSEGNFKMPPVTMHKIPLKLNENNGEMPLQYTAENQTLQNLFERAISNATNSQVATSREETMMKWRTLQSQRSMAARDAPYWLNRSNTNLTYVPATFQGTTLLKTTRGDAIELSRDDKKGVCQVKMVDSGKRYEMAQSEIIDKTSSFVPDTDVVQAYMQLPTHLHSTRMLTGLNITPDQYENRLHGRPWNAASIKVQSMLKMRQAAVAEEGKITELGAKEGHDPRVTMKSRIWKPRKHVDCPDEPLEFTSFDQILGLRGAESVPAPNDVALDGIEGIDYSTCQRLEICPASVTVANAAKYAYIKKIGTSKVVARAGGMTPCDEHGMMPPTPRPFSAEICGRPDMPQWEDQSDQVAMKFCGPGIVPHDPYGPKQPEQGDLYSAINFTNQQWGFVRRSSATVLREPGDTTGQPKKALRIA